MTKQEQRNAAWAAYGSVEEPARAAYEASYEPAYKVYKAIREPAWAACKTELERIDNEPEEDIIEVNGKRYQLIK